jgi:hypothetical protein
MGACGICFDMSSMESSFFDFVCYVSPLMYTFLSHSVVCYPGAGVLCTQLCWGAKQTQYVLIRRWINTNCLGTKKEVLTEQLNHFMDGRTLVGLKLCAPRKCILFHIPLGLIRIGVPFRVCVRHSGA